MTQKPSTTTIITAVAAVAATAVASYALFKLHRSVKELEDLALDFGNDDGLTSMLTPKYNKKD